jgi:transcriptional regulator with XRE-family HTH domain
MPRPQRDPDPRSLIGHFGSELRYLREQAKLGTRELAELLGYTPQWVSQIELGDAVPSKEFAEALDTFFKTGGSFLRMWASIKKAIRGAVLLPSFPRYLELESKAVLFRCYASQVVPGLLQTEAHIRAVMPDDVPPEAREERVANRLERQAILLRERPPKMLFVLDESILHRLIGPPKVMAEQMEKLVGFAESDRAEIRVLPYTAATHAGWDGKFMLLSFADEPDVAYIEGPEVSQLIEDQNLVARCAVRFDLVMGEALPRAESTKAIMRAKERFL